MRQPSRCPPSSALVDFSGGKLLRRHHLDRVVIDALADDLGVEASDGAFAKVGAQLLHQRGRRVEMDTEAPVRPQRKLDQPLEHAEVVTGIRLVLGHERDIEARYCAVLLLERKAGEHASTATVRALLERAPGQRCGAEEWIEQRGHRGRGELEGRAGVLGPHATNSATATGQSIWAARRSLGRNR